MWLLGVPSESIPDKDGEPATPEVGIEYTWAFHVVIQAITYRLNTLGNNYVYLGNERILPSLNNVSH